MDKVLATKRLISRNLTVIKEMMWLGIENNNETIVNKATDALCRFTINYGQLKQHCPKEYFEVSEDDKQTPTFFSLTAEALEDLAQRGTWVEWKVLKTYQMLFDIGMHKSQSTCFILAVNTRLMATSSLNRFDLTVLDLCIKFFNTFIGNGILQEKVKTVYNILHQYRAIGETLIHFGAEALATGKQPSAPKQPAVLQISSHLILFSSLVFSRFMY